MEQAGIYARESPTLGRYVQIGVAGGKVISVSFPESVDPDSPSEHPILDRIFAYLAGDETDLLDVTVALTVPTDRRRVLEATRNIPYGEQVPLELVARMAGVYDPDDDEWRTIVQSALAENPAPLLLPDHRVWGGPSAAPPAVAQKLRSIEGI